MYIQILNEIISQRSNHGSDVVISSSISFFLYGPSLLLKKVTEWAVFLSSFYYTEYFEDLK